MNLQEVRQELRKIGFVHVTDIETDGPCGKNIIQRDMEHAGKIDYNNGMCVVVTEDGEVWIRTGSGEVNRRFAKNGYGAFVPCSNGEWPTRPWEIFERVANPDYVPIAYEGPEEVLKECVEEVVI